MTDLQTRTGDLNIDLALVAFDPVATPANSKTLQDILDSPPELAATLAGHVRSDAGAPDGAVCQVVAIIHEIVDAFGHQTLLKTAPDQWLEFIGSGDDAYERGLGCQITYRLLRLLGTPCTERFPLAATLAPDRVPPAGTIQIGRGGYPTRPMSDLEIATLRYAVTPLPKFAVKRRSQHGLLRRSYHVSAAAVGFVEAMLSTAELTHVEAQFLAPGSTGRLLTHHDPADHTRPPINLGPWASHQVHQLRRRDNGAQTVTDGPLLYSGGNHPDHLTAITSTNNAFRRSLSDCGLDNSHLNSTAVRLWGARQAINAGSDPADVARRLALTYGNGDPDTTRLADALS